MKEEQKQPLFQHHRRRVAAFTRKKFTKPAAYVILLLLSYFFGYLSAPSSNSQYDSPPVGPRIAQNRVTQDTAAADNDHYRFTTQCGAPVPSKLVRQTILDRLFNGTSPYDNFPPAHATTLLRKKKIKGWGSNGAVFENLIRKVQPKTIIEVGTFLGASAIHMAQLASGLGLKTQILCIDDFRGWPGFRDRVRDINMVNGDVLLLYQFMQNVVHENATESVLFVPFSSGSALQQLCEWGVFGDLIEVDAGHDFHSAWSDINRAYKLLRPDGGGVIFGHDYFTSADNKGVRRAVHLFARVHGLRVQIDGQHWVIHSP
ncbi:S-adenosyl-L-methionine-dependent methyltransferases superfamily protein [Actinidia rufa]|uniref:S-adenosyl-L-methionine-dependent methyltransferases superfamily protein n=1 Tax=Actinidia rufa TaxID=165716 RepID=A0A7J0E6J3_9ERIC|nr:S-adenosyl-L-methionine-dependent methyltransferases superfamily protein [Actinidia rufa]